MDEKLIAFSKQFINDRYMAVVGCVSEGSPRVFTCWYCVSNGKLYWKSRTSSVHSRAFSINPEASLCIYDHMAKYPDDKMGVQLIGKVYKVTQRSEMQCVIDSLAQRFGDKAHKKNNLDELCAADTTSTFYSFTPEEYKLVAKQLDVHMDEYQKFSL